MDIILFTLWFIAIVWSLAGVFKILYPNWALKQYINGKFKLPNDSYTRLGGIVTLLWGLYILFYLLGYIK